MKTLYLSLGLHSEVYYYQEPAEDKAITTLTLTVAFFFTSALQPTQEYMTRQQSCLLEPAAPLWQALLGALAGDIWKTELWERRHSQFRIKVTELLVDFDIALPALQFGYSPLVFITISLADTVQACLGDFLLFWDYRGVVDPSRERHRGCSQAWSPKWRAAGQETGETMSRPSPLLCQGHSHCPHTRQPQAC